MYISLCFLITNQFEELPHLNCCVEWVVWPPRVTESKGLENGCFKFKKIYIYFLHSSNFKVLSQKERNSVIF